MMRDGVNPASAVYLDNTAVDEKKPAINGDVVWMACIHHVDSDGKRLVLCLMGDMTVKEFEYADAVSEGVLAGLESL